MKAKNKIGYGEYSETNTDGVVIATEPHKMVSPYLGTDIDLNKLEVLWYALFNEKTGGSVVTSYNLQYDQGTGQWLDVIGDETQLSLALQTVIRFLSPEVQYKFRVRALNIYGWGAFSDEVTFFTSDVPLGSTSITTQIFNMNVRISWVLPFANYMPIDGYLIEIRDTTGTTYNAASLYCNGL